MTINCRFFYILTKDAANREYEWKIVNIKKAKSKIANEAIITAKEMVYILLLTLGKRYPYQLRFGSVP